MQGARGAAQLGGGPAPEREPRPELLAAVAAYDGGDDFQLPPPALLHGPDQPHRHEGAPLLVHDVLRGEHRHAAQRLAPEQQLSNKNGEEK